MLSLLTALLAALPAPASGPSGSSKELGPLEQKLPLTGKVKECCGYPLSAPRGFKLTFYWLAWEAEYANEPYDTEIYTRDGFFLGRYPRTFVYELRLEGSGVLRDGRVINYDGDCGYGVGTCFRQLEPAEYPVGMGGIGRALEPFRSVAVDPRYIPLGTTLYLPQLVGVQMPGGGRHDGCVRADDTGGGIRRRELDFFVESYAQYKLIADRLWWDMGVTPLVEEPRCAYLRRGDPSRDRSIERTDWAELHRPGKAQALARAGQGGPKGGKGGQKVSKKGAAQAALARKDRPGKGKALRRL